MNICDNPYSIPTIDINECVGISLATINNNYADLKDSICTTTTLLDNVSSYYSTTNTKLLDLSAVSPGIVKAWVVFDGTNTNNIYSKFRVASVSAGNTGTYSLSFVPALNTNNYALVGTSFETSGGGYTWLQPTTACTTRSAIINIRNTNATLANAERISVLIYHI